MTRFAQPFDVAIIGTGASGILAAAQFKRMIPDGQLAIIGNETRPARGLAYQTQCPAHLLNVRACNMSAYSQDLDHFVNWLKPRLPKSDANTYAPRHFYGDYLSTIFHEVIMDLKNTKYFHDSAVTLSRDHDHWTIHLEHGEFLEAYNVILALGNSPLPAHPIDFSSVATNYFENPWGNNVTHQLQQDAPILLIGTGLTMVDVTLSLRTAGHQGPVHAISRHGRLYQSHRTHQPRPLLNLPVEFKTPVGAFRWIRREISVAEAAGFDWRAVIDSLRPHTARIWQSWTPFQRGTFLRHARNLWDIHRHRIAPQVSDQLGILVEDRDLIIHRGKLLSAIPDGEHTKITWKETNTGDSYVLSVARIINCTGPVRDYAQMDSPLIDSLRSSGWLTPDALKLGIETDPDGRLLGCNGKPVDRLYTLGPTRIPSLWESIAIPEIRNQAAAVAQLIAKEILVEAFSI
jgi:uncharacterized NAD(P)/FAD-binding protein YdhS